MASIPGLLAFATACAFASAALYINLAEHPARMRLDARAQLMQWKPSYDAALKMQVSLLLASGLLGIVAAWIGGDWRWLVGAALILANMPYTLIGIFPTNRMLKGIPDAQAGETSRVLLARWARLHAVRSGLGLLASAAFLWVAASP